MKIYITILISYLVCGSIISQNEIIPPQIEFINVIPEWVHISNDTNYIVDFDAFPNATTFSNKIPLWMDFHQGFIYLFEQNLGPQNGLVGFTLYKLDAQSGQLVWSLFDNFNSGQEYNINYFNNSHRFSDGVLSLFGYSSLSTIPNQNGLFFYSRPVQKDIDIESGNILATLKSDNEIAETYTNFTGVGFGNIHRNYNNNLFHFQNSGSVIDTFIHNEIYVHKINDVLEVDSNFHKRISFNTGIKSEELSLVSRPLYRFLSDSSFVSLNLVKNVEDIDQSPKVASIEWWAFDSVDSINSTNEVDITEYFHKQTNLYNNLNLSALSGNVVINQYIDESTANPDAPYSWLVWFGEDGELLSEFEFRGNSEIDYSRIKPLFVEDSILYFSVYFEDDQFSGNDIFKIEPYSSEALKIGSIKSEKVDSIIHPSMLDVLKMDDNNIIIAYRFVYDIDASNSVEYSNINYYFNFNLGDLGVSTQTIITTKEISFQIFPNPTQDFIVLEFNEELSGEIKIRDNLGRQLHSEFIQNKKSKFLDISILESGVYYISIIDSDQSTSATKQLVKF